MFYKHDISRDALQLYGSQEKKGYDWWWHSFTAHNRKDGHARPFYIEYFLCNPDLGQKEPVFGQLPENKARGIRPSYLMVNVGTWGKDGVQVHRFFGWKSIQVDYGVPYSIQAQDCFASENRLKGSVSVSQEEAKAHPEWMSDAGEFSWDVQVEKVIPFNVGYGASKPMRDLQLFEMFWHAEGMKARYKGEVIFNGEVYTVDPDTCYGYADKNWGKDFTTPWLWLSSCHLTSEITGKALTNSVFDIGGGRPKIGPISLKGKLLSAFFYEGKGYEFNFAKFWTFTRTRFQAWEDETKVYWHVEQKTWRNRMVTDIQCNKAEMLLIRYEAPDGSCRHCRLWNGGNGTGTTALYHDGKLVDRMRVENAGCEYGEYDAHAPYTRNEQNG